MANNLDFGSFILQLYNLVLLLKDYNNTDLMKELQKQDNDYFQKIINNQNEILKILKRKEEKMEELLKNISKKSLEKIKEVDDSDITPNNIDNLGKLIDIVKDIKEVESMYNYGNYGRGSYGEYGRRPGYDSYGEYGNYDNYGRDEYGRRGRDMKYRGDDELDRLSGEYGRYMENRSRYGAGEETDKSFYHMTEAYKDFGKVLQETAETPKQQQMLRDAVQSMMM